MIPAFPKPSQVKKIKPAVRVFRDGREVCDQTTKAGRDEYERRKFEMRDRQKFICPLCNLFLPKSDTTYDHWDGRGHGAGHRDDRIFKPNPRTGELEPYNSAVHWLCNSKKGSRRYNPLAGDFIL